MQLEFEPKSMTLSELSEYYIPHITSTSYRTRMFIFRLLMTDAIYYLSVTKKNRKLHGNNLFTLQDVWVIVRRLGWPPLRNFEWMDEVNVP